LTSTDPASLPSRLPLARSFVPLHFRQPFIATVGLAWVAILSLLRGRKDDKEALEPLAAAGGVIATSASSHGE
jgi:hypothetical protein